MKNYEYHRKYNKEWYNKEKNTLYYKSRTRKNRLAYYVRNKERILKRNKEWAKNNKRKIFLIRKKWRINNLEYAKQRDKEYSQRPEVKQRKLANYKIRNAIKSGKIIPKLYCELCGNSNRLEKHHNDYTKPLEVVFLCVNCHRNLHRLRK